MAVVVVVVCNAPRGFSTLVRERRAFLHAFAPAIINLELLRDYSECYAPMRTEDEIRVSALLYWLCRLPPPPLLARPSIFIAKARGKLVSFFPRFRRNESRSKIFRPNNSCLAPYPCLQPGQHRAGIIPLA